MKIVHIVIVKFKSEINDEVKEQAVKDILALKGTIPEIKAISAGKNFTDRGKGYEYGWVIELEKKEDLPIYANHQSHLDFLSKYKPALEDVLAIDYEF
ncbi:stress responsive A/B barrel domain-containing protein [Mycotypha africana]|uniref:stress responsive A/B barrel domain-containing protein n=1 Tax=Mycotypha africana TaxID=64632 RepID=UPI0023006D31|nr:stress responsive A/B barrel domain-containing protein [Mycotypha africana]KAI8975208.1 stress responsive A/B barrel domain-containing protein [Mycotypha africana]